jgi:dienelactone hydrolase
MKKFILTAIVLFCTYNFVLGQHNLSEKDIQVFKQPADTMMQYYLTRIVDRQFAERDALLATFKTADDWKARAQVVRDSMVSWTGPLPERTPLNARTTRKLDRDGYTVENILFESRPNYLVSANLYLPKNISSPRPALLNVIGHAQRGKADERYQRMSIAMAKKGFVVLTIDCVGQGERGLMSAHRRVGAQAFISGTHLFNIMVWDAIRAIDYLVSRPEVDAEKICITGSSGGGMMTTYILPFDDRIAVAIPTCNPNTWSHRVNAGLATDHEQVFFGTFESGIDPRGDPLLAHVPKPLLLNTTTDDHLNPPRGVWDLSTWLHKAYATHGSPEKIATTMVKAGHAYNQEMRELTYSWILRWTGNDASNFWEEDGPIEKDEDLWAAAGGSVFNEPGSRQHLELVWDYLNENKPTWGSIRSASAVRNHKKDMTARMQKVLNINLTDIDVKASLKEPVTVGEMIVRQFVLQPEEGIVLPGVLLEGKGASQNKDIILYLNENGKSEILKEMDIVKGLLENGHRICAVDLRGIGETSPDMSNRFWDFLIGKPIFGQRVQDILAITQWLKGPEVKAQEIKLWGTGMCALYGAFAGVASDDISGYLFEEPLISFESVVQVGNPAYNYEILLPGILQKFDMPQVYQALAPVPVMVLNPYLGDKKQAERTDIGALDKTVSQTYAGLGKRRSWSVQTAADNERRRLILDLLGGSKNYLDLSTR